MKKGFLILCLCGIFTLAHAQREHQRSLIIQGGMSVPVGNFGDTNVQNEFSGFAGTGPFVDVGLAHQLSRHFGVISDLRARINRFELRLVPLNGSSGLYTRTGTWTSISLASGIYQPIALTENGNVAVEFREMIALQYTRSPSIKASSYSYENLQTLAKAYSSLSPALIIGTGFTFRLSNSLGLKVLGDYNISRAVFTMDNNQNVSAENPNKFRQDTGTFDLGLGLLISL